MAAVILTLVLSFVAGGAVWLVLGSRLNINDGTQLNDLLNLLSYMLIALPLIFIFVFYVLEHV